MFGNRAWGSLPQNGDWKRMAAPMYVVGRDLRVLIPHDRKRGRASGAGSPRDCLQGAGHPSFPILKVGVLALLSYYLLHHIHFMFFCLKQVQSRRKCITSHQWSATHHTQCRAYITHRLFSKYLVKTNTQKEIKPRLLEFLTENMTAVFQHTWDYSEGCLISSSVCWWWLTGSYTLLLCWGEW